jgi:hypothetical protein
VATATLADGVAAVDEEDGEALKALQAALLPVSIAVLVRLN